MNWHIPCDTIFFFVNVYSLLIEYIELYKESEVVDLNDIELITEFRHELYFLLETLRSKLFSRMDQYIKLKIKKRGITIVHNNYCGFDSEYVSSDSKDFNELVSVQTACQDRTILKVPLYNPYDISYVNPLSS